MPSRTEGPPRGRVDGSQKRYRRWSCVRRSCERSRGDGGGRRVRGEARWSDEPGGGVPKNAEALARTHHGGDGVGELLRAGGADAGLVHEGGERALFVAGEGEDRVAGPRRHARVEAGDPARVLHRASSEASGGTEWETKPRPTRRGANATAERERGTTRAAPRAPMATRARARPRARAGVRGMTRGGRGDGVSNIAPSTADARHRRGARGNFYAFVDGKESPTNPPNAALGVCSPRCLPAGRRKDPRRARRVLSRGVRGLNPVPPRGTPSERRGRSRLTARATRVPLGLVSPRVERRRVVRGLRLAVARRGIFRRALARRARASRVSRARRVRGAARTSPSRTASPRADNARARRARARFAATVDLAPNNLEIPPLDHSANGDAEGEDARALVALEPRWDASRDANGREFG
jgi:hypothetical protein